MLLWTTHILTCLAGMIFGALLYGEPKPENKAGNTRHPPAPDDSDDEPVNPDTQQDDEL